uniref:NADH-ubiquinone oxidoreductase chain 4 n=1 Tax=Pharyngomonas kirbyi TaxID=63601 RepID=A0A1W6R285_9EUKA|nr:NADH dehydrogenase subunit 4 [Pharyngomonas kirbyi]ARO48008.1 NADH dehydrogenase subunit 4 [Pharyngomonas kirbyi]
MYLTNVIIITIGIAIFLNYPSNSRNITKYLSLVFSLILFLLSIITWIIYNPYESMFQFYFFIKNIKLSIHFGIDGISLLFIFLTTFLFPICMLYNWNKVDSIKNEFYFIMVSMELFLLVIFSVQNLLLFYIFFEIILVPLFILIGINNYKTRRIHASLLLFLYTLFGSLFMLITLLYLYFNFGSLNYNTLYSHSVDFETQKIFWILLFLSMSVKIPLFPFHIWLPEAHVEAPTEGSVILAGVLLKLGIYGFIRILIPVFYEASVFFMPLIFSIATISGIYASFSTLKQTDIKRIIAYSSIAHMSIGVVGLFTMQPVGLVGSILLMFSHGIVSGGLFLIIGMLYDRFKTKTIFYYSGITQLMPLISLFFFLFTLGNISFPGTSSFIGESMIMASIVDILPGIMFFLSIVLLACTLYSLLIYNRVFFGITRDYNIKYSFDATRREFHLIIPVILLMLWIGIYPIPFIELIESNVLFMLFNSTH